ncbi:MAG: hypothetical protein V1841_01935 [Patescibacteria group bacterium]
MSRNRVIKPEFWDDEKICKVKRDARLTFIGLWNNSDDYGVVKGHPGWLKSRIFPYDEDLSLEEFKKWLDDLEDIEVIIPFIAHGESYYFIVHFSDHQKIDKPSKTRNPEPPKDIENKHSSSTRRLLDEYSEKSPKMEKVDNCQESNLNKEEEIYFSDIKEGIKDEVKNLEKEEEQKHIVNQCSTTTRRLLDESSEKCCDEVLKKSELKEVKTNTPPTPPGGSVSDSESFDCQNEKNNASNPQQDKSETKRGKTARTRKRVNEEYPLPPHLQSFFDEFWTEYIRKVSKNDAKKAIDELNPDIDLQQKILAGERRAQKFDPNWIKRDFEHVKLPGGWIRQRRWEDEYYLIQDQSPAKKPYHLMTYEEQKAELLKDL